jgi:hypothetical protein
MNTSLNWLVTASVVNLVGNILGTVIAVQQNLAAELGSVPNAPDVLQDFLSFKGTALSAPLSFMLIQVVLTLLALRPGPLGRIGVGALTFIGLFYTLAQAGEPILLRQFQAGGFDVVQFVILLVNILSAIMMLLMGIRTSRTVPASQIATT